MELLATDAIRFMHVLSVCIGLGASFLADIIVLSRLKQKIDDDLLIVLHKIHGIVWLTLLVMWISGISMIYVRTGFDLANFTPKLIAKVVTVSLLTLNALVIGSLAFPYIRSVKGQSIKSLPVGTKLLMAFIGGVSSASWILALAMGISKTLAQSNAGVFLGLLPLAYFGAMACAFFVLIWNKTKDAGPRNPRVAVAP